MWLRQVALIAHELDLVVGQLEKVLGLKTAFNDPEVVSSGSSMQSCPWAGNFSKWCSR
jgi:hypothetical protein